MKSSFENMYHLHDARDIQSIVPKNSIDVIITSPPYGGMKNYGVSNQIGYDQSYLKYQQDLQIVFQKCYDALKMTGSMWIIVDSFKKRGKTTPLPFQISDIMDKLGWILQDIIIWDKVKTIPYSRKGQFRNIFEYILFYTKTKDFKYNINRIKEPEGLKKWWVKYPERYNPDGKNPSNIWRFKIPTQGVWGNGKIQHFCPFPPRLVERIISLTTNKRNVVMDPFAGSGVVLAQAKCMNRKYVGFDINENFIDRFHNEIIADIEGKWQLRQIELDDRIKKKRILKHKIENLRKLKYPVTLLKLLKKTNIIGDINPDEEENLCSDILLCFCNNNGRERDIGRMKITIVMKQDTSYDLKEYVAEFTSRKPLSKYGLESDICYKTLDEISEEILQKKHWIYSNARFHKYHSKDTIENLLSNPKLMQWKKIPPIVSDIKMYQEIEEFK